MGFGHLFIRRSRRRCLSREEGSYNNVRRPPISLVLFYGPIIQKAVTARASLAILAGTSGPQTASPTIFSQSFGPVNFERMSQKSRLIRYLDLGGHEMAASESCVAQEVVR